MNRIPYISLLCPPPKGFTRVCAPFISLLLIAPDMLIYSGYSYTVYDDIPTNSGRP
jgi:hypothetical protein